MLERILWSSFATPANVVAAWRAMRLTSTGCSLHRAARSSRLMVGSVATAMVVTQVASCSMDGSVGVIERLGEAGEAQEGAEELLAVLGPVVGVRHAAAGDGLRQGTTRPQRPRRRGHRGERRS